MLEFLFKHYVLAIVLILIVYALYRRQRRPNLPNLPWLNTKEGELFTTWRATLRSTFHFKDTIHHAYEQVWLREPICVHCSSL